MSVSAISSSSGFSPIDWQAKAQQIKTDYQSLAQALQSGDLNAAQKAFTALQKDFPAKSSTASTSSTSSSNPNNPMNALSQALQSGNLSAAQQAFAQLQQTHRGHHRHHGGSGAATGTQSGTTASATPSNTGLSGAVGDVFNIVT
jgi:outer membrane protein assembly factor BamD (BamD/ComL family)